MPIEATQGTGHTPGLGQHKLLRSEPPKEKETREAKEHQARNTKIAAGVGLAALVGLGAAFKDGLKNGFQRIGDISNQISNIFTVPFSLLFPYATLNNEFTNIKKGTMTGDDSLLNRMVYTAASLGFTPMTWGEPLKMGTRSTPHLIATILNLPHTLFTFLSYTGGRFMSVKTAVEKNMDKDNYMLEQKFNGLYKLGNLGSAQASVIPMSGQCVLGWETILDIFKGNFGSAMDRFRKEPMSVVLGTLFNSWAYPFEYLAKCFDTTIRTAESVDQFRNAFSENSLIIKFLDGLKIKWHENSKKENFLGKFLKWGREASKIEALLLPPVGMISILLPTWNRFLKGEIFNKEAQGIGGTIGFLDKVFNIGAVFTHLYYTGTYTLSVRLPQTITTANFYITNLINKITGKQLDPDIFRKKIFDSGFVNKLSNWASKKLDDLELQLHPNNPQLINNLKIDTNLHHVWIIDKNAGSRKVDLTKEQYESLVSFVKEQQNSSSNDTNDNGILTLTGTGKSKHIRNFHKIMADEVCFTPLREALYSDEVYNQEYEDKELAKEAKKNNKTHSGFKEKGKKPSQVKWGERLQARHKTEILDKVEETLRTYLQNSQLLNTERIDEFIEREYKAIKEEVEKLVENEIAACNSHTLEKKAKSVNNEIKSKNLLELFTNWQDLKKVIQLKTFHVTNSILPLWVRGFVDVVDYGKTDEPFWLRNLKAQETGIREGDVKQACDREFMPVVAYSFQTMGKGLATIWNLLHGKLPAVIEE